MINIKNIKLRGNKVLVTYEKERYDYKKNGIIVAAKGSLSEYQRVMEVGSDVNIGVDEQHQIKTGDMVMIDFTPYFTMMDANGFDNPMQKTMSSKSKDKHPVFTGDIVTIDNVRYCMINAEDIIAVVEGDEVVPEESAIIKPVSGIITNIK